MSPTIKIWCTNSFGGNNSPSDPSYIFYIASHFNHSCVPSIDWKVTSEGYIWVVAHRDINVGEEITISYIDTVGSARKRRDSLAEAWGFICRCQACEAGLTITPKTQGKWPHSDPNNEVDSYAEGLPTSEEVIEAKSREAKLDALIEDIEIFHHHMISKVRTLLAAGTSSKKLCEAALLAVVWKLEKLIHGAFPGFSEHILQGYLSRILELHLCVLHMVRDPVLAVEWYFKHIEMVLL